MRSKSFLTACLLLLSGICSAQAADSLQRYSQGHPLYKGQHYLARGHYWSAADFYRSASKRFEGTAIGMEALYLEAESYRRGGRYQTAIGAYRRLQREYPFSKMVEEAQYQIAWCYAQGKSPTSALQAVSAVDLLLASYPESRFREPALALREEAMKRQKTLIRPKEASPEALFDRAKEHFERRKYIDAMEGFKEVVFNHPGTRMAAEATFYLGECYFRTKDYQAAVDEYTRLLEDYPTSPFADDAQYMIAYGFFKQSPHWALDQKETGYKAKAAAARFFERYPESPLAPEVKQLQAKIDEKLAHKEFEAGRIYYKMKKPKSARIYFSYVLEQYPETAWAQRARDYLSKLDREYPEPASSQPADQEIGPPSEK